MMQQLLEFAYTAKLYQRQFRRDSYFSFVFDKRNNDKTSEFMVISFPDMFGQFFLTVKVFSWSRFLDKKAFQLS